MCVAAPRSEAQVYFSMGSDLRGTTDITYYGLLLSVPGIPDRIPATTIGHITGTVGTVTIVTVILTIGSKSLGPA
jgi:hypothetical protein